MIGREVLIMRAKCFIAAAILVSICNALAAISIDPIARTFTKTGGAATGNAKFFKVVVPENKQ